MSEIFLDIYLRPSLTKCFFRMFSNVVSLFGVPIPYLIITRTRGEPENSKKKVRENLIFGIFFEDMGIVQNTT